MIGKTSNKILYFDCFSGISGDMVLGALIDLGVPLPYLRHELSKLRLDSFSVLAKKVKRDGITATKCDVEITPETEHGQEREKAEGWKKGRENIKGEREKERTQEGVGKGMEDRAGVGNEEWKGERTGEGKGRNLVEIRRIIEKSSLDQEIKERSVAIFRKMIEAEAKIHGVGKTKIHLHEMGAIDAIVDVVGACIALKKTGAEEIIASPINVGRGFIRCDHGVFPIPAPATLEILKGIPLYSFGDEAELTTPTGASIISAFASRFVPIPGMEVEAIGYGAGTKELGSHPNLLRVILGRADAPPGKPVTIIETTIDDMNMQIFGYLMETLFESGALEVFHTSVLMKKNRPGILVTVICQKEDMDRLIGILFRETTTIGVRFREEGRRELERTIGKVRTKFGTIRVKKALFDGKVSRVSPEYDDCVRAARKFKVSLRSVQSEVLKAAEKYE